jgi:hypothetical protein
MADKSGSYTSAFYMAGSTAIFGGCIFFLHLCFFKNNSTKREQVTFSNLTDHPLACTGPGTIELEDKDADK